MFHFRTFWRPLPALVAACVLAAGAGVARATVVVPPTFEQLVGRADYIVRATVKSVHSEMAGTPTGEKIITLVELDVSETIAGLPPAPLVLVMPGGKVGDEEMRVDGVPAFKPGDENVFFVRGNGRVFCPLVGLMHGNYPIKRDASGQRYVARSNGAPLYAAGDVAAPLKSAQAVRAEHGPAQPLSPDAFVARIRQTHALVQQRPELAR